MQRAVVHGGDPLPRGDELVEPAQVHQRDRGVELAHAPAVPRQDVLAAHERRLPLVAVDASLVADALVARHEHAPLATRHELRRIEGERRRVTERACGAPTMRRAVRVGGVLE